MKLETANLVVSVPSRGELDPREVLEIFNSNPDFIDDSDGGRGKRAYTLGEVEAWPEFQGPAREHQRFLVLRLREDGRLIGLGDVLAPHPRGSYAAIGLLIIHKDWQGRGLGR